MGRKEMKKKSKQESRPLCKKVIVGESGCVLVLVKIKDDGKHSLQICNTPLSKA